MTRPILFLLTFGLCSMATAASAQSPWDLFDRVENFIHSASAKAAKGRWSKLSQTEYSCVSQKLRDRGDNLDSLVQRGMFPSDPRVAEIRSQCREASSSELFKRFYNRAYRRSGHDVDVAISNYRDCENACVQSPSCIAVTYFRSVKFCRMMEEMTELETDVGAESAVRVELITSREAGASPAPSNGSTEKE